MFELSKAGACSIWMKPLLLVWGFFEEDFLNSSSDQPAQGSSVICVTPTVFEWTMSLVWIFWRKTI